MCGLRAAPAAPDASGAVQLGDVVVDLGASTVRGPDGDIRLTPTEWHLLTALLRRPGKLVGQRQLLQEVWGYDYYGGTRTVDVHVRRLRAKLGSEHEVLIGTVRNVGYRFVPESPDEVEAEVPVGVS